MRILIQDSGTARYLDQTGGWTECVERAGDFTSSEEALRVRRERQLAEAKLVFRFEREGYSISVPLEPLQEKGDQGRLRA